MEGARAKTRYGMHSPQTQDVPDVSEHLKDVQELLAADVAVMVGEFEEVLEWIDAEISRMLRPKRVSTSFLDGVETEVEVEVDGSKGTAYGALLEAGATNDWNEVLRLLEYPDPAHNFMLRAWQLVSTPPLDGQQEDDAKKARSALHAAALGGHEAMVLYLMYKTAIGMPTDAKPGDHAFCSTVCEAVKQLPAGAARARADYSFRALVMLRGQHSYTQRLDVLCEAVGEKQDWMDEEEEGLFSACFADLKVNAELGRAVARELDAWIASCVQKRSVLQGLLSTSALVNSIIFCIKSVQHQFERLDQLARPRLSKPSSLSSRWRVFVQQIEANMGQRQGLAGQALSDMLCWPLQRSMRYKDLLLDLIHGAACCSPGRKEPIGSSGVCPKDILDAVAKDYGPPSGAGSGGTRSGGTCQSSARQEVIELATRVDQAHLADKAPGPGMGAELLGALAVLFRVKDETMLLNVKVAEIASRREAADKACFYLENMQGAQHVVSSHCEFVAHCSATCRLPEGPGTWSQGKTLKVLLLRGTRRQLLFYTEALGVSGTTRTCLLKVDMSSVISISEPQESDATTGVAAKASKEAGMQEGGGVRETYTMTLQLRSQDGTSSSADQSTQPLSLFLQLHYVVLS